MADEPTLQADEPAAQPAVGTPPPDINVETYPFETVQHMLDQAAYFNLYSVPKQQGRAGIWQRDTGACIGFAIHDALHRFNVRMQSSCGRLRAANSIGEALGRFSHRWMICPDDFDGLPGLEPPATPLDPTRRQRFVMLDAECRFGDGPDGFRGFGSGTTCPAPDGTLLAAAVGNVMEGSGRFQGLDGTYVYCGRVSEAEGFLGSVVLRVMDPAGVLQTDNALPTPELADWPEPGITYFILRGHKKDGKTKTSYSFDREGHVRGLNVTQQLSLLQVDAATRGSGGLRAARSAGPVVGRMSASIVFDLLAPAAPGTPLAPIPFQSFNEYTFEDDDGRPIGSFTADGYEGRTFTMQLPGAPGQRALRFGGFGPLVKGTGSFRGIEGFMSDNSVVGIAPHAIATFYVIRIHDDKGRYRE